MTVAEKIHNGWILKASKCTLEDIRKGSGLTWNTVQKAISTGKCSPATMDKINAYFQSAEYQKLVKG